MYNEDRHVKRINWEIYTSESISNHVREDHCGNFFESS